MEANDQEKKRPTTPTTPTKTFKATKERLAKAADDSIRKIEDAAKEKTKMAELSYKKSVDAAKKSVDAAKKSVDAAKQRIKKQNPSFEARPSVNEFLNKKAVVDEKHDDSWERLSSVANSTSNKSKVKGSEQQVSPPKQIPEEPKSSSKTVAFTAASPNKPGLSSSGSASSMNSATDKTTTSCIKNLLNCPSSVMAVGVAIVAKLVSLWSYKLILKNQVPLPVAFLWAIAALLIGREVGRRQMQQEMETILEQELQRKSVQIQKQQEQPEQPRELSERSKEAQKEVKTKFPNVYAMLERMQLSLGKSTETTRKSMDGVIRKPWTTLNRDPNRKRQPWEIFSNHQLLVSNSLTKSLLDKTPRNQRRSLKQLGVSQKELEEALASDGAILGVYADDPYRTRALTLEEDVVDPMCPLRGFDIFMTDSPESSLGTHSFLIENGLRDKPLLIINGMTQWANVVIYFELPEWVKDWDTIVEEENDPENVIALKVCSSGN